MTWFSTKVRIACLIEGIGLSRYMDSVHIFQATDFAGAMERAIALGRSHEAEYLNVDSERVRWRLASIVSLDMVGEKIEDGVEVYSEPIDANPEEMVAFDHVFEPERSEPTQTI